MRSLLLIAALAACSPAAPGAAAPPAPDLAGSWRVAAIDGQPPLAGIDAGRPPTISFGANGYGGNVGCNGFGGIGLAHEGRWYGGFAMSTAMSCGPALNAQEGIVQGLLGSGPRIAWQGADRVVLATDRHRVALARAAPPAEEREALPPPPMIGSLFSFAALDGKAIQLPGSRSGPTLAIEGDRFTLTTPCRVSEGGWAQSGVGAVTLRPTAERATPCPAASKAQSAAWVAALRGPLRYSTGPNGELVLAGGGHWMVGDALRRGSADTAKILGRWQVEGAPAGGAELVLTRSGYRLWDGCNRSEGLAILFERTLHIHSGQATLANCPAGRARLDLGRVLGAGPRIGLTANGLRLVSQAGEVRLRRVGAAPAGPALPRPAAGMRFRIAELGGGTLTLLPGNRFRLVQPCGTTEGRWRFAPGEVDGALRFGPERSPDACMRGGDGRRLSEVFLGNVELAIGPNRDLALFAGRFGAVRARMETAR